MRRTADPGEVDRWVCRDFPEAESLAFALSEPLNVCLAEGEGGLIFVWSAPGIYECHCFFEQRGKAALAVAREAFDIMRRDYGATTFWAAVPVESRKVALFVRWLGWRPRGSVELPHGTCNLFIGD